MEILETIVIIALLVIIFGCIAIVSGPRAYMKPNTPEKLQQQVQKEVNEKNKDQNIAWIILAIIFIVGILMVACQQG